MHELTEQQVGTIKDAASKLTGPKRRAFQAQVTLDYLEGRARRAERVFGWGRETVELGLHELWTGIVCLGNFSTRGNKKTEEKHFQLEQDIRALADANSQQDPKFQSPFLCTRMTAKAMRKALIGQKGWTDEHLPHENTIGVILNRLSYKLRRVRKAKPLKKVRHTDAISDNVERESRASDEREDSLRLPSAPGVFPPGPHHSGRPLQCWDRCPPGEESSHHRSASRVRRSKKDRLLLRCAGFFRTGGSLDPFPADRNRSPGRP
jgi:hypothetical protein